MAPTAMPSIEDMIIKVMGEITDHFSPGYTFQVEDYYGLTEEDLKKRLAMANTIIVIWDGDQPDVEAFQGLEIKENFTFLIIEQTVAVDTTSTTRILDKFRSFMYWRKFDHLIAAYPNSNFQPFFPDGGTRRYAQLKGGITVWMMAGHITHHRQNITGT